MAQPLVEELDTELPLKATRDRIIDLLPRLRRFCMGLTGSSDAGDDLTQSTVERALTKIDRWQEGTRLDSWVFRIARNINIDEVRARTRSSEQCDNEATDNAVGVDGREITETRSTLAHVTTALRQLSPDQRALVEMVIVEGKSYREAAEILDIPVGTVMSRIARARFTLANAIEDTD